MKPLGSTLAAAAILVWAMAMGTLGGLVLTYIEVGMSGGGVTIADGLDRLRSRPLIVFGLQWFVFLPVVLHLGPRLGWTRESIGSASPPRPLHVVGSGLALGATLLLAPALVGRVAGGLVQAPTGPGGPLEVVAVFGILAVGAVGEEVLFRGILLRVWEARIGTLGALALTTVIFAIVHAGNPGAGPMGGVGLILAGGLLGLAALRSGGLWWPSAIHLGWNAAAGLIVGLPVSGVRMPSLLHWTPSTADGAEGLWGGSFGPEAGVVFHTALLIGIVWVARRPPSPESRSRPRDPGEEAR